MKRYIFFILFISFLLSLIFFTYKDYGVPWDEKVFFNTGKYYAIKILDFMHVPHNLTNNSFEPTPYHIKGHGVFYDVFIIFASLLFKNFNFETLHLLRALFSLPIFFLTYWIVNKLLNRIYAFLSLFFLLLLPRFYPEIFYNAIDVPTTLFFTISLAYFIYYAESKQTTLKSVLFGLILAITINQRLLLFYLPIVNFIFLLVLQRKNLKQLAIQQSTIFASTIFFLHLTHPYLLAHPLTGVFDILKSAKQYPWNAAILFDGQFYQAGVKPLPWYYLPKSMLITIPLSTLILFFIGNVKIAFLFALNKLVPIKQRPSHIGTWLLLYVLLVFYIPIILTFTLKPTLYDSWRQFLFLTIPMIVIAMYGLNLIINLKFANSSLRFFWKLVIGTWIFISLGLTSVKMINLHPYEYLYFNLLVGGLKGAYGKYETDYWGLGYKEAVLWFNKNINDPKKQYKIFVEGDPLSSSYYFKPNMQLTTDLLKADYIFTFTRWNFHLRHPGKTIYTVKKEGVPLIFIKKL